jgi:hypothetical protein
VRHRVGRNCQDPDGVAAGQLTVRLAQSLDYCGPRHPGHVVDISPFENTARAVLAS